MKKIEVEVEVEVEVEIEVEVEVEIEVEIESPFRPPKIFFTQIKILGGGHLPLK